MDTDLQRTECTHGYLPYTACRLIAKSFGGCYQMQAAESDTGARVVLSAVVDEETIRLLRYQVFGCPHLIAAAEAFCDEAEGKGFAALTALDVPRLMNSLAIPVEKTGRVFVLEDAAKALHITVTSGPTR